MILILTPSLHMNDAVGNDAREQKISLMKLGFDCELYSQFVDEGLLEESCRYERVIELVQQENTLVIYHHCVLWVQGEEILKHARCKVLMKYHNITPSEFFENYDNLGFVATKDGVHQTVRFIHSYPFVHYMAASSFNAKELTELGVPPENVSVIEPLQRLGEFETTELSLDLSRVLDNGKINVLFVGRVVPNKGHKHLIRTIRAYVDMYGPEIQLNIVGSLSMTDPRYYKELEKEVSEANLGSCISFIQNVNFCDLVTYYKKSDIFLLMSEHEGFCVPVLEAQISGLPIVALIFK